MFRNSNLVALRTLRQAIVVGALLLSGPLVSSGCKRSTDKQKSTEHTPAAGDIATSNAASPSTSATNALEPAENAPESFEAGTPVVIGNSGVTGCTVRALSGWAQVRCVAKNERDGSLRSARVLPEDPAEQSSEVKPATDGTLSLVLPWQAGKRSKVRFEWSDMTQDLWLSMRAPRFTRVLPPLQAEQCERFSKSSEQILAAIRAKIGPYSSKVTPKDVYRFPALGGCRMAGQTAWALSLDKLSASGEGPNRQVNVTLALHRVDATGDVASFAYGPIEVAPEGLLLPELMFYDYDADGEDEVIVRRDILIRPLRTQNQPLPRVPAVFTYKQNRIAPYAALPPLAAGGIFAEHLDTDGRPDVGDYGPFMAWLPEKCGRGECPRRLVGPRFFLRSNSDGTFTADDEQAQKMLRNKCERAPEHLVVDTRSLSGKQQTAQNIACARVRGVAPERIVAELQELKLELCDDGQATCVLLEALTAWARLPYTGPVVKAGG